MAARGRPRTFDRHVALRAAMELFWQHGYEGTSLNMLTTAMGITPTSLYAAFGSKDALFKEAVELYNSVDTSPTDQALERTPTRAAIEAVLRDNADAYVDPTTPRGCMVVLSALNLGTGHEHLGGHLAELRQQDLTRLRDRICRGQEVGDLPKRVDAASLASFVLTLLEGLAIRARDGCTREQAHAVIDVAMLAWDSLVGETRTASDPSA